MRRRQRETSGVEGVRTVLLLVASLGTAGCSLDTSGLGDPDARTDTTDVDVPPVDVDADGEDDTPLDGPECQRDFDCGDLTCADGWLRCVDNRCVPMDPWECPQDLVLCTRNSCPGGSNACDSRPIAGRCTLGYVCNQDFGCTTTTSSCSSDGECGDGIACTVDRCVPGDADGMCIHDPEDADGDTVGGNYGWLESEGRFECPGGDCDDTNPEISPDHPEICGNGIDDDCDTLADYADRDSTCTTLPPHDSCETAVPLVVDDRVPEVRDDLATEIESRPLDSWCVDGSRFEGRAAYFRLDLSGREGPLRVVFDTKDCGFDTVLSLFQGCGGGAPELICNDDRNGEPTSGSRFEHRRLDPGLYIVRVAGRWPDQAGAYTLRFSVEPAGGEASCGNPIDASDGGTFIGWLSDPGEIGEHTDRGSCVNDLTGAGDQERFVIRPPVPIDLFINSAGTQFPHALYLRGGDCTAFLSDDACVQGAAGAGEVLFLADWAGTAYITLDWVPPLTSSGNPDRPYQLLILQ